MTAVSALQLEARQTIQEALGPFGYGERHVRFGWQVPNAEEVRRYTSEDRGEVDRLPSGKAMLLDALAFADDRKQDWHTSAIAIDLTHDGIVGTEASREQAKKLFSLTAAPTNLIGSLSRKKVDVWFNCHDGIAGAQGVDLAAESLKSAFRRHRSSVQRDLLAHLRTGQRHFFDGQLYARRDELASFLQRGVSKATWVVGTGDAPWGTSKDQITETREAFSRVALALLAARILEDKGALDEGRGQSTDARQLLEDARGKWDSFFDTVLAQDLRLLDSWFRAPRVDVMLQCLLSHLTGPVNFSLVTHEMLGDLYERALVAERSMQAEVLIDLKGVHYTPIAIARRILDRIPLEDLPVEHRTVCDFACGSGSFLLAATDRLAKLFDPREASGHKDATAWLSHAVMGNDIDPVAVLVTQLSYLVAYWNRVDEKKGVPFPRLPERGGDALTLDLKAAFGRVPSVIVGNPPFDLKGHPASEFLDRALTSLLGSEREFPGYIGMVMPGLFLKGLRGQEATRSRLLNHTRILEVWELPEHAIGLCAETPTCVIIAEVNGKEPPGEQTVRACQTISRRNQAVDVLRDQGVTTWSYAAALSLEQKAGGDGLADALAFSPIDDVWARLLRHGRTVSSIAEAVWGFTHTKAHGYPDPEFSSTPDDGFVPYIRQQGALRPYFVTEEDWRGSHDDDRRYWKRGTGPWTYERNWGKYESPKILISSRSNRNALSQLVAALDFAKYYPGKDFVAVTLLDTWTAAFGSAYPASKPPAAKDVLRWICAILNSVVGHAWFAKHAGPRGPQADVCLTMPLPRSYDPAIAREVERLQTLQRPANIGTVPTWNPSAGLITPPPDLFGEAAEAARASNEFWQAVEEINGRVLASYELDAPDRQRLTSFIQGMVEPWVEHRPDVAQLPITATLRVLRGKVLSVNALNQTAKVELSWKALGDGAAVSIPIPKFMPGWALRHGVAFICKAPAKSTIEDLRENPWLLRDFEPVPYAYLPTERLEEMIGYKAGASKS